MIKVKFSNGQTIEIEAGATVYDAAAAAELISREVLCATVDGKVVELSYALSSDAETRGAIRADIQSIC